MIASTAMVKSMNPMIKRVTRFGDRFARSDAAAGGRSRLPCFNFAGGSGLPTTSA